MAELATYIVQGLRSPFARIDRELASYDALQLSVPVLQQTVVGDRGLGRGRDGEIDLMIWGSVIPNLSVSNWGREVWLDAKLDPAVPALTIVQQCASSLAAATHAAAQTRAGQIDLAVCGGVESMSCMQIGLTQGLSQTVRRAASSGGPGAFMRTLAAVRPRDLRVSVPQAKERTTGKTMGQHTEEMVRRWNVSREEQDRFALASHLRAVAAGKKGVYRRLLVSPGTFPASDDPIPRSDTSLDRLAALRPAFGAGGSLTAGNSSPLTDGAAACWVASAAGLDRFHAVPPHARLLDWEQAAVEIAVDGLLMAPAIAIPRLLARHDLGYADIDLWEIHEAFAGQVLSTIRALENREWLRERAGIDRDLGAFPQDRVNPNGGSVALGHPFAATGARLLSQTVLELAEMPSGSRAVISICAAGGLGHVALLESV
ncbi:MAG: acetyl-CoA C-acyltransferase [Gemmatimonadota bacterium]|jgi:acetyl-CoA C-acetyltransferase|nr:MAG: acetyl-CoA C-acyltransferase [Gemmatimonadota bacterium]